MEAQLKAKISLNTTEFQQGINNVKAQSKRLSQSFGAEGSRSVSAIGAIAGAILVLGSRLGASKKQMAGLKESTGKMSQAMLEMATAGKALRTALGEVFKKPPVIPTDKAARSLDGLWKKIKDLAQTRVVISVFVKDEALKRLEAIKKGLRDLSVRESLKFKPVAEPVGRQRLSSSGLRVSGGEADKIAARLNKSMAAFNQIGFDQAKINPIIGGFQKLGEMVAKVGLAVQGFGRKILQVGSTATRLGNMLSKLVPMSMIANVMKVGHAITMLGTGINMASILANKGAGLVNGFSDKLLKAAAAAKQMSVAMKLENLKAFAKMFDLIGNSLISMAAKSQGVKSSISKLFDQIKSKTSGVVDGVNSKIGTIGSAFGRLKGSIARFVGDIKLLGKIIYGEFLIDMGRLKNLALLTVTKLGAIFSKAKLSLNLKNLIDVGSVIKAFANILSGLKNRLSSGLNLGGNLFAGMVKSAVAAFGIIKALSARTAQGVVQAFSGIKNVASGAFSGIYKAASGFNSRLQSIPASILAIGVAFAGIATVGISYLSRLGVSIAKNIGLKFQIASSAAKIFGSNLTTALARGILGISSVGTKISSMFKSLGDVRGIKQLVSGIKMISSAWAAVKQKLDQSPKFQAFKNAVAKLGPFMRSLGKFIWSGFSVGGSLAGIGVSKVFSMIKGAAGALVAAIGAIPSILGTVFSALSKVALAAGTVAAAFAYGIKSALDFGSTISDLAARAGTSAGEIMILRQVFDDAGASVESLPMMLDKLSSNLSSVNTEGKEARGIIQQLGLNVDELQKMSPAAAFEALVNALSKVKNGSDRTAAAIKLFGKSGGQLNQILADPKAFENAKRELGSFPDLMNKNAAAFDQASDAIKRLKTVGVKGFFAGAASGFIDEILAATGKIDDFNQKLIDMGTKVGKIVGKVIRIAVNAVKEGQVGEILKLSFEIALKSLANQVIKIMAGLFSSLFGIGVLLGNAFAVLFKPDFWAGMKDVLIAVVAKVINFMLVAFKKPLALLQAGLEYAAQGFVNILAKALTSIAKMSDTMLMGIAAINPAMAAALKGIPKLTDVLGLSGMSPADNIPVLDRYEDILKNGGPSIMGFDATEYDQAAKDSAEKAKKTLAPIMKEAAVQALKDAKVVLSDFMEGYNGIQIFDQSNLDETKKKLGALLTGLDKTLGEIEKAEKQPTAPESDKNLTPPETGARTPPSNAIAQMNADSFSRAGFFTGAVSSNIGQVMADIRVNTSNMTKSQKDMLSFWQKNFDKLRPGGQIQHIIATAG